MDPATISMLILAAAKLYLDISQAAGVMTEEEAKAEWAKTEERVKQANARWEAAGGS